MSISWRATLADGRVITEDGSNTPQAFLDQIVRFELIYNGMVQAVLEPSAGERVLYRRRTAMAVSGEARVSVVFGLLSLTDGGHLVAEIGNGPVRFSRDIKLTDVERV